MTGILEVFALTEVVSGIGFLASWRNHSLAKKVNYFRPPHCKKSPFDRFIRNRVGRAVTKQDCLRLRFADGLVSLIRTVVQYDAFRQFMRALALPHSPLRQELRGRRRR